MGRRHRPGGVSKARHDPRSYKFPRWLSSAACGGPGSGWSVIGALAAALFVAWILSIVWSYLLVALLLIGIGAAAQRSRRNS